MSTRLLTWVVALGLLTGVAAAGTATRAPAFKAGLFSPARLAPDFSLQGSNGQELEMSQFRGRVVLLSFGYSSCTAVCPITLATLAQARRQLGPAATAVQVVYVTVDPERDTLPVLASYVRDFAPEIDGLLRIADGQKLKPGQIVAVSVTAAEEHDLAGRLVA